MNSKKISRWILALVFIFALAAFAGCASKSNDEDSKIPATGAQDANGQGTSINVNMTDFAFQLDQDSAPAGQVTFHVKNTGKADHEMVVIKTDLKANELPKKSDQSADENQLESKGEVEAASGGSEDLTVKLDAGHYVLLCNEPGHYQQGMASDFTVK